MHIIVASEGADRPEALLLASVLLLELIGSDDTQSPVFIEEIGNFRREVQLRSLGLIVVPEGSESPEDPACAVVICGRCFPVGKVLLCDKRSGEAYEQDGKG